MSKLFDDLSAEIARHPSWRPELSPGFFDQKIPVGSDWNESLARALSAAEVFVPLYSPGYLARPWPGREWACFHRRMELAGLPEPQRRFVPVLWTPLHGAPEPPGLHEALELGTDVPDYAENGLQALLRFQPYRDSYRSVVRQLAERIITIAEELPLEPSAVPDIDTMNSAFLPGVHLAEFTIEIAAPAAGMLPAGRSTHEYGEHITQWRPFPQQELPLTEYVRQIVERLDFSAQVSEFGAAGRARARGPGIIVIDPWFIHDEDGRRLLRSEAGQVPRWVLPMLVRGSPGDIRSSELTRQVAHILGPALATESSRQAVAGVSSLKEFVSTVEVLVAEAERQYLRYGGVLGRHGRTGTRPRLGITKDAATPNSAPRPAEGDPSA